MIKTEFDKVAELIVSLRREAETLTARFAALEAERNELAAHVSAHVDALKKSNAQCAEYLRQNEKLRAELETARVAAASLERIQATAAKLGASGQEDAGHFIERTATDLEFMHLQLVEVRSELASVSAERDSLKRTLKEWEEAETAPHVRVAADDIADHVVPPILPMCTTCHGCGSVLE